jgi:hypothetical protein
MDYFCNGTLGTYRISDSKAMSIRRSTGKEEGTPTVWLPVGYEALVRRKGTPFVSGITDPTAHAE